MIIDFLRTARWQLLQAFLDSLAWLIAVYFAASQFGPSTDWVRNASALLVLALALHLSIAVSVHLYQGRYRFGSFDEAMGLAKTVVLTGLLLTVVYLALTTSAGDVMGTDSLSVPICATAIAAALMFGGRLLRRALLERARREALNAARRALVFGAGVGGVQAISAMLSDPGQTLLPVAALDDDPSKRNLHIMGVPVVGDRHSLREAAETHQASLLVVAVPSANAALIRSLTEAAGEAGLDVMVVPSVADLVDGHLNVRDIREVKLEDLLGRRAIETDLELVAEYLAGKRVLVTGAGGSIGSELCREISRYAPASLVMLDRDESALHAVQLSISGHGLLDSDDLVLADIRDLDRLIDVFETHRPEIVFHAAALKHLPLLERSPAEAVKSNVWGTISVLDAAARTGVGHFVNISTDKAADPTSVLGFSKRLAERLTAHVAETTGRPYVSVRFGNVLGSRGSVITAFQAQAAAGGPLTVTHPDVTRFFMTVREAVQLVIQAAAVASGGEVLVLDMGEPVRINDVARQVAEAMGEDIEIRYTGLRSGEKLHETLFAPSETQIRRVHPMISQVSVPPLNPSFALRIDVNAGAAGVVEAMRNLCLAPVQIDMLDLDVDTVVDIRVSRPWDGPERRHRERTALLRLQGRSVSAPRQDHTRSNVS